MKPNIKFFLNSGLKKTQFRYDIDYFNYKLLISHNKYKIFYSVKTFGYWTHSCTNIKHFRTDYHQYVISLPWNINLKKIMPYF